LPILSALNGTYTVNALCSGGDSFAGTVTFTGTDTTTATFVATPPPVIGTTTTVGPISNPVAATTPVGFSATVAPTSTGSVQFLDGGSPIGSPVAVAAGTAAFPPQVFTPGTHSITATYSPDAAARVLGTTSSTSAAQTFTVPKGIPTVTLAGPPSIGAGGAGTFDVSVNLGGPGTFDLAYSIAGAAPLPIISGIAVNAGGTGSFVWNVSPGQALRADYAIIATYHPTDTVNFQDGQTGTLTPFEVTKALGAINNETITVTVPAGALSATVVSNPVVVLSNFKLSSDGSYNTAEGLINPVKVTDTRAGDIGWVMSAKASPFVGCAVYSTASKPFFDTEAADIYTAASHTALVPGCTAGYASLAANITDYDQQSISAFNLGILPFLSGTTTTASQVSTVFQPNIGVVAQPAVQPDLKLPSATTSALGLGASRNLVIGTGGLANAAGDKIGSATGVVSVNGALTLKIPTVTMNGAYASTLTITVI
jgi:hypothetical protein